MLKVFLTSSFSQDWVWKTCSIFDDSVSKCAGSAAV